MSHPTDTFIGIDTGWKNVRTGAVVLPIPVPSSALHPAKNLHPKAGLHPKGS